MIQPLLFRKGVMDGIRKWFTAKEAAEYMGMHPETVYRFLQRKELRSVKAGRTYRVKSEWCDAFLMGENQWVL